MKTITLHIDEAALGRLRQNMMVRKISGAQWGLIESFAEKIINEIDAEKTETVMKINSEEK